MLKSTFIKMKLTLAFIVFSTFLSFTTAARILFMFPFATKSHTNVYRPLVDELTKREHELVVVTSVPSKNPPANVKQIVPIPLSDFVNEYKNAFEVRKEANLNQATQSFATKSIKELCHQAYQHAEFVALQNEKFDVVIMAGYYNHCFDGLIYKIGAPHILITTQAPPSHTTEHTGNYLPSSFVPMPYFDFSDRMSFYDRFMNMYSNFWMARAIEGDLREMYEEVYRQYLGEDTPGYFEIRKNVSLILMNSHFSLNYPRPNLPDNIEIGGMHCRPGKALPKELDEFISNAKHGVIYFSLGSVVTASEMPEEYRKVFVNVFSKLKQKVLWKWETEEMPDLPSNVKLSKWLPQQDVLAHPNVKLFISHGGFLSTVEAVYHGVPVLGIPLAGDQDSNMRLAERLGFGIPLEILNVTEDILALKLNTLLDEPRYTLRARELSSIFSDQPQTPLERAVFWTEYVIRHKGAPHLRSAARNLNYFQVHSYDTIGFVVVVIIALIKFITATCKGLIQCCKKKTIPLSPECSSCRSGGERLSEGEKDKDL